VPDPVAGRSRSSPGDHAQILRNHGETAASAEENSDGLAKVVAMSASRPPTLCKTAGFARRAADSASSILVTRSTTKRLFKSTIAIPLTIPLGRAVLIRAGLRHRRNHHPHADASGDRPTRHPSRHAGSRAHQGRYTAENLAVRVMVSIVPGDMLIPQYTVPT
jgi:hypothetical protein